MKIYQMVTAQHKEDFKALSIEYMKWIVASLNKNFNLGIVDEVEEYIEEDMKSIDKLMLPKGHLLLFEIDGVVAEMAGMRQLGEGIAEIKRMYIRPKFRGNGYSRILFNRLLEIAKDEKYTIMRLDSGQFMTSAHGLYRSAGFTEIDPYEESEVSPELKQYWIFFERSLT